MLLKNYRLLWIVSLTSLAVQAGDLKPVDAKKWAEKPQDVAKDYIDVTAGGMFEDSKKIAMPECSVGYIRSVQGAAMSNMFANKGLKSNMVVFVPFGANGEHDETFQAIADASCERFQNKLKALGFEVLGPAELAQNERYAEYVKEDMVKGPVEQNQWRYYGATAWGTPKDDPTLGNKMTWWKLNRDIKAITLAPRFNLKFGQVKGSGSSADLGSSTVASTSTKFTGELEVSKESRIETAWEHDFGVLELDERFGTTDASFVTNVDQVGSKTDTLSAVGSVLLGSRAEKTSYWAMEFDYAKFKEEALAQLDVAENLFVERIKNEMN